MLIVGVVRIGSQYEDGLCTLDIFNHSIKVCKRSACGDTTGTSSSDIVLTHVVLARLVDWDACLSDDQYKQC